MLRSTSATRSVSSSMASETSHEAPASPTLTDPDMILPQSAGRNTPSPPPIAAGGPINTKRMSSINSNKRRSALGPRLPIAGTARPSMPGSWQSESDVHESASQTRKPASQSPGGSASRLSRTGSARIAPSWSRATSRDGVGATHTNGLLGSTARHRTLAERLEEEDSPDSPLTATSESNAEDDDDDDDIGSKAEEILANAKKRLTAMEGNLNRARSLSASRTGSPASAASDSMRRYSKRSSRYSLLPGAGGGDRIGPGGSGSTSGSSIGGGIGNGWALASSKTRQASLNGTAGMGHLRVFSETAAATARGSPSSMTSPQRSLSAMGHGDSGSPSMRTDWTDTSSIDSFTNGSSARRLEPLREDELYGDEHGSQASQASPLLRHASSTAHMYASPSSSTSTLSRARSSIALRDLQEGVGDLKDKVQQLKERTKRDSMKRASLQRLKSPSPFTHAEQWSEPSESRENRNRESKISTLSTETAVKVTESTPPRSPGQARVDHSAPLEPPLSATSSVYSTADLESPVKHLASGHHSDDATSAFPLLPAHPKIRHIPPTPTTPRRRHTPSESLSSTQTSDENDLSEPLSPSVSDAFPVPPATTPTPPRSRSNSARSTRSARARSRSRSRSPSYNARQSQSLSHEDNPDAFDYSRFLLDSAMGTYVLDSAHNRSRSPSVTSTGTQSTTRPRKGSMARLSKVSNASSASHASTAKRISLSPSRKSTGSSGSSNGTQTIAQRRASSRTNSNASLRSISLPDRTRSASPNRKSAQSEITAPSPTLSPPAAHHKGTVGRPGHTRQLSTDSISASSVASFATAIERVSSQLTMRSLSRNHLLAPSPAPGAVPTHRADLEAYPVATSRKNSFASAVTSQSQSEEAPKANKALEGIVTDASPLASPTIHLWPESIASPVSGSDLEAHKRDTAMQLNALLINEADALQTPTSPSFATLPASITKASSAILSAVLAISYAAVREDDDRRVLGVDGVEAPRAMDAQDEAMLGRVLEGILGAAIGLIGRSGSATESGGGGGGGAAAAAAGHGSKGNSWRSSSMPGVARENGAGAGGVDALAAGDHEVDEKAVEQQRDIWRMRCEVARRALTEEKPGEGF